VDEGCEHADVFWDVERRDEGVAVGNEVDAVVLCGGNWEGFPGFEARVIGLEVDFIGSADEEDIGGEVDDGFAIDFKEAITSFGADVLCAGECENLIDEGFAAGNEHEAWGDEVKGFGVRRVGKFGFELVKVGLGAVDGVEGRSFVAGDAAERPGGGPDVGDRLEVHVDEFEVLGGGEVAEARGNARFGGLNDQSRGLKAEELLIVESFIVTDDGEGLKIVGEEELIVLGNANERLVSADEKKIECGGGDGGDDAGTSRSGGSGSGGREGLRFAGGEEQA
jgi:hypothetical protein